MQIREALTFDDVLLVPGASEVMPTQVSTSMPSPGSVSMTVPSRATA